MRVGMQTLVSMMSQRCPNSICTYSRIDVHCVCVSEAACMFKCTHSVSATRDFAFFIAAIKSLRVATQSDLILHDSFLWLKIDPDIQQRGIRWRQCSC